MIYRTIKMSGHQSSILGWSVKTVQCLSDFRPVIGVTAVIKNSFRVPYRNIIGGSMHGLCTMSVAVKDVFTTTWPMLGYRSHHRLPPVYGDRPSNMTKAYLLNDVTKQTETQAHILHKSSIIVKRFPVYVLTSQMRKPHCGRSSNVNDLVDLRNRLLLQKPI